MYLKYLLPLFMQYITNIIEVICESDVNSSHLFSIIKTLVVMGEKDQQMTIFKKHERYGSRSRFDNQRD
jgi:hypothetical protein